MSLVQQKAVQRNEFSLLESSTKLLTVRYSLNAARNQIQNIDFLVYIRRKREY